MLQKAGKGMTRTGYRGSDPMPSPHPLAKAQLSSGTKMRVLTVATKWNASVTQEAKCLAEEISIQIYTHCGPKNLLVE